MKLGRISVASVTALMLVSSAAWAEEIDDQRSRVQSAQTRVAALEQRLGTLLRELASLEGELSSTSARLGSSGLQLVEAERRVEAARIRLSERARRAYMQGGRRQIAVLMRAQTFLQFFSAARVLSEGLSADTRAYQELIEARDAVTRERVGIDSHKRDLLDGTERLEAVRAEITSALRSEQAILSSAQAELDRLLAARRRASKVSPAVEARRAARQIVLDQKLAALLAWYAPGSGAEPFMPPNLRGTGITSTGLTSWYGPGFDGRRASSGATYRMNQLTAASLVLPFGTLLKVTYRQSSVVVVITDRGPYVTGRVLDLSWGAAEALGLSGVKEVQIEIVLPAGIAPPFP